jgi:hypothetical protein
MAMSNWFKKGREFTMPRRSRLLSGLLISSALIVIPLLWGAITSVTIFSDLTGTTHAGGYVVGQYLPLGSVAIGTAFTPTGPNYKLSQIQALLSLDSGVNDMTLRLYQGSGDVPGSLLESWHLVNVLGSTPSIVTVDSVKNPKLVAGQQYWITATMSDLTSRAYWWGNTLGEHGVMTNSWNGGPFSPGGNPAPGDFPAFAVMVTTVTSGD